jgi:outer membrane murein-binding lipoprotein Lpp
MVRAVAAPGGWTVLAAIASASLVLTGCSSTQQPEVEQVATTFGDPGADARTRCDLLAPATLEAFEQDEEASCAEAIEQVPLDGGEIESVEIWGGDAQVRLSGDTLFLTRTRAGWRVSAAACESRGEAPYECGVEGP